MLPFSVLIKKIIHNLAVVIAISYSHSYIAKCDLFKNIKFCELNKLYLLGNMSFLLISLSSVRMFHSIYNTREKVRIKLNSINVKIQ